MHSLRIRSILVLGFLFLALSARPSPAQCLPDGLDGGPCCLQANVVLPSFPAMSGQSTKFMCFNACTTSASINWCANFGVPTPMPFGGAFVCGVYDIPVRIRACPFNLTFWGGKLRAYYSRNWQASSVAGTVNLTVWRFLVNGDLKPTSSLPMNQNVRPACNAVFGVTYFTGYIDYVYDCSTNQWQIAWNLNHECDGVHHSPASARPAPSSGFHPTRSYSFVGPGNTFSIQPINLQVSNGQIIQQAMRKNDWINSPAICTFEEPATGAFTATSDFCQCSGNGPKQYNMAFVQATGACGSSVQPSPLTMLMQKRLGMWTNPNVYPGIEMLLFDFGYLDHKDGCTGAGAPEWFEGCETIRGYPAVDFTGVNLGTQFEDLGSCNQSPTAPAIFIGAPHVVNYVLNFNLP